MKRKIKTLIILVLLTVIGIASGLGYYFLVIDKEEDRRITPSNRIVDPSLFQACDEDSCIYLLGTIHVGDDHLTGLTDKIWKAYNASDAIAFELDITKVSAEEGEELIYLPEGKELSDYLTEEQLKKLEEFCLKRFISMDALKKFNLAGVYSLLSQFPYLELGYSADNGVDKQLLDKSHQDNKEIIELETYEMQASLLYEFKDEYYVQQIDDLLNHYAESKKSVELLYNSYLSGNIFVLRGLLSESDETDELSKEYNQKMLTDRNLAMADKAEVYLKENKKVMVAVGAAHVIGEKGLVDLLEDRGYKVSLVK